MMLLLYTVRYLYIYVHYLKYWFFDFGYIDSFAILSEVSYVLDIMLQICYLLI